MNISPPISETPVIFFLDRTHQSRETAKLLRKLGVHVELHKDHFQHDAPDPEWIPICASNGWIILSGDKGLEHSGINRAAVIQSGAKVFLISDHRTRGIEQTAALIAGRKKIAQIAQTNIGPFYCSVGMARDEHVGRPHFQPGGRPLETTTVVLDSVAVPEPVSKESGPSGDTHEKLRSSKRTSRRVIPPQFM